MPVLLFVHALSPTSTDLSGTSPLQRTTHCPPGIPLPPPSTVPPKVPHDFVPSPLSLLPLPSPSTHPPSSKAAPQPQMEVEVAITGQAGKQNAAPQPNRQMQDANTAQAGKQTSIHDADRTRSEPFPKPAPIVLPMTRFGKPMPN